MDGLSASSCSVLMNLGATARPMRSSRWASFVAIMLLVALAAITTCSSASAQSNEWTWMNGSSQNRQLAGVYGQIGVPTTGNTPGGRSATMGWTDANGDF